MAKKILHKKDAQDLVSKIKNNQKTFLDSQMEEYDRIQALRKSKKGLYKVIGIDKFSNEDWVHGEYKTPKEALEAARDLTEQDRKYASDASIATVYYAYTPDGKYLGGDTWENE